MKTSIRRRFWEKVSVSGGPESCWEWKCGCFVWGYGQFRMDGKYVGAHRVAWTLARGPITGGLYVLHRCDNRRCCNPSHLFLGTHRENNADRIAKGRFGPWAQNTKTRRRRPRGPMERFWGKVSVSGGPDSCWEWKAGHSPKGYGLFRLESRKHMWPAHRLAWYWAHGEIPDGLWVLHHCDHPACCNPRHLFLGTNNDNVADKMAKGRYGNQRREKNGNSKLTEADVQEIRRLYATGQFSQEALGVRFKVGQTQISNVVRGHHWPR